MNPARGNPYLAFSVLLLLAVTLSLLAQTLGNAVGVPIARFALWAALPVAGWLAYGRLFPFGARKRRVLMLAAGALTVLGVLSRFQLDLSWDGMAYQQPAIDLILHGLNPLPGEAEMLWLTIYPAGVWMVEASVAGLYFCVEAAKMLHVWWLAIALPVLLAGLSSHFRRKLSKTETLTCWLMAFSPVALGQVFTHYIDAMLYLSGLAFLGALLLHREDTALSRLIMACCVLFMVNAKLTGAYHALVLCAVAVMVLSLPARRVPWKTASILLAAGLAAVLAVGYRPYVTHILPGKPLFPIDRAAFSASQRPANLNNLFPPLRFFYSAFSATGGETPKAPANLKWPFEVSHEEILFSGQPDMRAGGFGPLYALALLGTLAALACAFARKERADGILIVLAAALLLSSAAFPEGWWLRYVPFAYAAPLLALIAIRKNPLHTLALALFAANTLMAAYGAVHFQYVTQTRFNTLIERLQHTSPDRIYLNTDDPQYAYFSHAFHTAKRRLEERGIAAPLRVSPPCPDRAGFLAGIEICITP